MKILSILLLIGLICTSIYGATDDVLESLETVNQDGTPSSTPSSLIYTYKPDLRKCAAPMCGGYFLTAVNGNGESKYASSFILSLLDPRVDRNMVRSQSDSMLVRGVFARLRGSTKSQPLVFVVMDVYRYPRIDSVSTNSNDRFVLILSSPKQCFTTPCYQFDAEEVNNGHSTAIEGHKEPYTGDVGFLDSKWLNNEILKSTSDKAIVRGSISSDMHFVANRVYIKLPDPSKSCPAVAMPKCQANYVAIYTRDVERCYSFSSCVESGACALSIPVCADGYTLVGYPGGKFGCPSYYCDPDFVSKTTIN